MIDNLKTTYHKKEKASDLYTQRTNKIALSVTLMASNILHVIGKFNGLNHLSYFISN